MTPTPEPTRRRPVDVLTAVAFIRVNGVGSPAARYLEEAQRAVNFRTAAGLGVVIRAEYVHYGPASPVPARVHEMLHDLKHDPVDYLITTDLDRLARDPATADYILRALADTGVFLALPDRVVEAKSIADLAGKYNAVFSALGSQLDTLERQQDAAADLAHANGFKFIPVDLDDPDRSTPGELLADDIRSGQADTVITDPADPSGPPGPGDSTDPGDVAVQLTWASWALQPIETDPALPEHHRLDVARVRRLLNDLTDRLAEEDRP